MALNDKNYLTVDYLNVVRSKLSIVARRLCLFLMLASFAFGGGSRAGAVSQLGKTLTSKTRPYALNVVFEGLFFFAFPNATTADPAIRAEAKVGIVSSRDDHVFAIEVKYTDGTYKTYVFPRSALEVMQQDIVITKIPDLSAKKGVTIQGVPGVAVPPNGWGSPKSRTANPTCPEATLNDSQNPPPCAFNWIIDFEGKELHDVALTEKPNTLRPKLHITTGLFYTRELSDPFCKMRNGSIEIFGKVAKTIGLMIRMDPGENLAIILDRPIIIEDIDYVESIKLSNTRYDPDLSSRLSAQSRSTPHAMGTAAHASADELQIFYDDLFDFPNPRDRFQFIPITKNEWSRNEPFVCYGGGGGTWP